MPTKSLAAAGAAVGLLGLLVAGPVRAQTVIIGSPIAAPVPVNPNTGHTLRHSRPGVSSVRQQRVAPSYNRRFGFEPRSARGYRRFHRGAVAPDFEVRGPRRRAVIINGGVPIIIDNGSTIIDNNYRGGPIILRKRRIR